MEKPELSVPDIIAEQIRECAQKYVAEIRAEVKADIAQECHYLLASGMGKKKSLEHLIGILEEKEGIGWMNNL